MTKRSRGQGRVNGLFTELRNHYLARQRLLSALTVPDEPGSDRATERSARGRAMASLRWR